MKKTDSLSITLQESSEYYYGDSDLAERYRILLVDDNEDFLFISKKLIERFKGFTVDTVSSATKGLEILQLTSYDAVISDYDMPEMNGIIFLEKIRSYGDLTPFMIFSCKTRDEIANVHCIPENIHFFWKGGDPREIYSDLVESIKKGL